MEHVRAGGGGGSVAIPTNTCASGLPYLLWVIYTYNHSSGLFGCRGDLVKDARAFRALQAAGTVNFSLARDSAENGRIIEC